MPGAFGAGVGRFPETAGLIDFGVPADQAAAGDLVGRKGKRRRPAREDPEPRTGSGTESREPRESQDWTALVLVNTVVYARDMFGGSNADVAIALACFGAGSMLVAVTAPRVLDRVPDRVFMRAGVVLLAPSGADRSITVSQHLAKLRFSGLVTTQKNSRHVIYGLTDGHLTRLVMEGLNHADHKVTGEPSHD